jgi:outer membrane protein assembly factor BamB
MSGTSRLSSFQRNIFVFISAAVTLSVFVSSAYGMSGDFRQYEHHFAIKDDYVYVMPGSRDNPGQKIEKKTGLVIWTSDFADGFHSSMPIFVDDNFFTMPLGGTSKTSLFRVSCESGQSTKERDFEIGCNFPAFVYTPILRDDLLITFSTDNVLAVQLADKAQVWELSCKTKDMVFLHDYFQVGESVYLLVDNFVDTTKSHYDALFEENLRRFEMVELDCSTGKILSRFDNSIFPEGGGRDPTWTQALGEMNGKELIAALYEVEDERLIFRLFIFDPTQKRTSLLFEESSLFIPFGYPWEWIRPVIRGDTIFYQVYVSKKEAMLVARDLSDGKNRWKKTKARYPIAATKERVFTYSGDWRAYHISCRDALTGEPMWETELERLDTFARFYKAAVSDGFLYLLTGDYMRALDVQTGQEVWHVQLREKVDDGYESGIWSWNRLSGFLYRLWYRIFE